MRMLNGIPLITYAVLALFELVEVLLVRAGNTKRTKSMKVVAYNRQFVNTFLVLCTTHICLLKYMLKYFHSLRKLLRYGRKNGGGFIFTRVIFVKYSKKVNRKRVIYSVCCRKLHRFLVLLLQRSSLYCRLLFATVSNKPCGATRENRS